MAEPLHVNLGEHGEDGPRIGIQQNSWRRSDLQRTVEQVVVLSLDQFTWTGSSPLASSCILPLTQLLCFRFRTALPMKKLAMKTTMKSMKAQTGMWTSWKTQLLPWTWKPKDTLQCCKHQWEQHNEINVENSQILHSGLLKVEHLMHSILIQCFGSYRVITFFMGTLCPRVQTSSVSKQLHEASWQSSKACASTSTWFERGFDLSWGWSTNRPGWESFSSLVCFLKWLP